MPRTIPYDPSIVLGNIVSHERIDILSKISEQENKIDVALDKLSSLKVVKRSLDMTKEEIINMNIEDYNTTTLDETIRKNLDELKQATEDYVKTVIDVQGEIPQLKEELSGLDGTKAEVESPIDYNRSALKKMPLAADSMKLDAQFFKLDSNKEKTKSHSRSIAAYVSYQSNSFFGPKVGSKLGAQAGSVADKQTQITNYQGTLVITANCTHKMVDIFAPFIIDVDKAVHGWNEYFPNNGINTDDKKSVSVIEYAKGDDEQTKDQRLQLVSGASYGSSFVGMVHIFREQDTTATQEVMNKAAELSASMDIAGWFAKKSGSIGVSSSFSDSVKSLLSTINVNSTCSIVTMGTIPSIQASTIETALKTLKSSPEERMAELAAVSSNGQEALTTVAQAASTARDSKTIATLKTDYMKEAVAQIGEMDKQSNQVIDPNSLMTAFDDFVNKAIEGNCGVPIKYFLKPITRKQICKAWVAKYYPVEFQVSDSLGDGGNSNARDNGDSDDT